MKFKFEKLIKEKLEEQGKTQRDLAAYMGLTESAISLQIRLKRKLYVVNFFKICWFLHLDPNETSQVYFDDLRLLDKTEQMFV